MKPEFDLEDHLLQATSAETPTDSEAAALREGFLAFGRGLEQATNEQDVERLLAKLREAAPPVAASQNRNRATPDHYAGLLWFAGLAAVLLVAVGATWLVVNQLASTGNQLAQSKREQPLAPAPIPDGEESVPNAAVGTEPGTSIAQSDEPSDMLAWDDSLEETFTSIEQRVRTAATLGTNSELQLETLNERIHSAAEEFDPTSL